MAFVYLSGMVCGLQCTFAFHGNLKDRFPVNGAGDSLTKGLIVPRLFGYIKGEIEQAGTGFFVDNDIVIAFQILEFVDGWVDTYIHLTGLEGYDTG